MRDLINQSAQSKDPNYCVRVTANDGEIGETFLREFQDNEKSIPTILTTSQKLSTGVNARNIRNIDTGFEELDQSRLPNLIELKYHSMTDAAEALGGVDEIRNLLFNFQKHLYQNA